MKKIILLITVISSGVVYSQLRFTDINDGVITDNLTNLVWQKCSMGQTADSECTGTASTDTWENALSYCENLVILEGTSDWRLPNINELKTIVDISRSNPAIHIGFFPNAATNFYWTSTTKSNDTTMAWVVSFNLGSVIGWNKTSTSRVRCVSGP